jgi:ankyrin repeat protein
MYAARADNAAIVSLLIENCADVNARSDIGETALMVASFEGSTRVAKLLVEAGADVNLRSEAEMTALINAAWRGRLEIVRLLIERGADVDVESKSGSTALGMSTYGLRNESEIARLLREAGANK